MFPQYYTYQFSLLTKYICPGSLINFFRSEVSDISKTMCQLIIIVALCYHHLLLCLLLLLFLLSIATSLIFNNAKCSRFSGTHPIPSTTQSAPFKFIVDIATPISLFAYMYCMYIYKYTCNKPAENLYGPGK